MEHQSAEPDEQAFLGVNGLLMCFNLTANIFYVWCLIFPPSNRRRLKQPLKMLLGLLVWCSIIYSVSLVIVYGVVKQNRSLEVLIVLWMMLLCYVYNSMACSVWLNVYYCIQIVPSRRALLVWLKKNIRPVIYIAVFLDGPFFFISSAVTVADMLVQSSRPLTEINSTWIGYQIDELHFASSMCVIIVKVHILGCLCIMMLSSFSTFRYLQGHIRRVAQDGSLFSTPRIHSQRRVTITGVSQGALYFLYSIFYLFDSLTYNLSSRMVVSLWVPFTVTSLYISGTTVNLGIGQTTFRKRAVEVWKALKALRFVGVVTKDVKMHTS